ILFQHQLRRDQREVVQRFIQCTEASESVAIFCLSQNSWKLDAAVDDFYSSPAKYEDKPGADTRKITALFNSYKSIEDPDKMSASGIFRLLEDTSIDPVSLTALVLAWQLDASVQGEFTRTEFVRGMARLGVDSLDKLKPRLNQVERGLGQNREQLRDLYAFTFNFARESRDAKVLAIDTAIPYWQLLLEGRPFAKLLKQWCQFLQENKVRGISRDTWNLFFDFISNPDNLAEYDPNGAWPSLIDEFVEHVNSQTAQT
uniref:Defective in cullin neddylation protein n=2 Tax=Macrostomum lignano TaxID=282301 RepID=A0A1I8IEL6_9PLAT